MKILKEYGFVQSSENEFQKQNWTVRIENDKFEIFTDPEQDTRYYYGSLDNLDIILEDIIYDTHK